MCFLHCIIEKVNEYKVAGLDVGKTELAIKNIKERLEKSDHNRARDLIRQTEKGLVQLKESKKMLHDEIHEWNTMSIMHP